VKPGTYRILRRYDPLAPLELGAAGRWANAEGVVQVTAGQETRAPTLEWTRELAEKQPSPTPRAPANKPTSRPRRW
jgi:hypothetical protein